MKKAIPYLIIVILVGWIVYDFDGCRQSGNPEQLKDTVYVLKKRIETRIDTVTKWKSAKGKIVYRTQFDTLATIDTVLIELYKADTIIKIDNRIIQAQDSIITDQSLIIGSLECEVEGQKQQVKKEKKKVLLWKGIAVLGFALNLLH